jgi:hypothetical protein
MRMSASGDDYLAPGKDASRGGVAFPLDTQDTDVKIEEPREEPGDSDLGGMLAYRLRQQTILSEFGVEALRSRDLNALLQRATELCAQGMGTSLCKLLHYCPDTNDLLLRAGVGWEAGAVGHETFGTDLASPAGYALKTGDAVISNHLGGESRFRTPALMARHAVKRAINVVIEAEGRHWGVLEVDSRDEGRFEEADLAFMRGFANLIGSRTGGGAPEPARQGNQPSRQEQPLAGGEPARPPGA